MAQVVKTSAFGGPGGTNFDDLQAAGGSVTSIRQIVIRSGAYVDNISTTYALPNGSNYVGTHGGGGGQAQTIALAAGEKIIAVRGRSGAYLDQISFVVRGPNGQKTYGPFGGSGGSPFELVADIDSFYGRSGSYVDQLGFFANVTTTGLYGGGGGSPFSDPMPVPGQTRIQQIVIRHGSYIDAISTTYVNPNGATTVVNHGGGGGTASTIVFNPGERIIAVLGRSGSYVDNLAFVTDQGRVFGPYGGGGGNGFAIAGNILGFVGRSGSYIDALGFYTS